MLHFPFVENELKLHHFKVNNFVAFTTVTLSFVSRHNRKKILHPNSIIQQNKILNYYNTNINKLKNKSTIIQPTGINQTKIQ